MAVLPTLARCDDRRLIRRHRAGDPRAREVLITRYLPLARGLALRYSTPAHPLEAYLSRRGHASACSPSPAGP